MRIKTVPSGAKGKQPQARLDTSSHPRDWSEAELNRASTDPSRFINKRAQEHFLQAKQSITEERSFATQDERWPEMQAKLEARQWMQMVSTKYIINRNIVREFMANLHAQNLIDPNKPSVLVRGKQVPFSAIVIQEHYGLPREMLPSGKGLAPEWSNEYQAPYKDWDLMASILGKEGQYFNPDVGRYKWTMKNEKLRQDLHIWNQFLSYNVMPHRRAHQIVKKRVEHLWRIATDKNIPVATLMFNSIQQAANSLTDSIALPRLITSLCYAAGVKDRKNEAVVTVYTLPYLSPDFWYDNKEIMAKKSQTLKKRKIEEGDAERSAKGKEVLVDEDESEDSEEHEDEEDDEEREEGQGPSTAEKPLKEPKSVKGWFKKVFGLIGSLSERFSCVEASVVEMRQERAAEREAERAAREEADLTVATERSIRLAAEMEARRSFDELRSELTALRRDIRPESTTNVYRRKSTSSSSTRPPLPQHPRTEDWDQHRLLTTEHTSMDAEPTSHFWDPMATTEYIFGPSQHQQEHHQAPPHTHPEA